MEPQKVLIMGAAGRDFHNFNVYFRENPAYRVVAFTATQIPNIADRAYPADLAGDSYPEGIPIHPESELSDLIRGLAVNQVVFAYSDVPHEYVMHKASLVLATGADFRLMGLGSTQLASSKTVVSVGAVRTGSGKSQTSRRVAEILKEMNKKVAVVRHPMPYGNLSRQAVQRFAEYSDLDRNECTIEEHEEYEPHLAMGSVVFAGVDYSRILQLAEAEADVILWDGGNNDLPFFKSDLHIVLVDPHRVGHESSYHPGEANLIAADVILINKVDTAEAEAVDKVRENAVRLNPTATVVEAESPISVEDPNAIAGKRVLVIEDGPTLTHGGMAFGAGWLAADRFGAAEIIDPRPFAVGSLRDTYSEYPMTGSVLPAMGYGDEQMRELEETIRRSDADLILIGTPIDLARLMSIDKPSQRVRYALKETAEPSLKTIIRNRLQS
jgi:predicted GTPase